MIQRPSFLILFLFVLLESAPASAQTPNAPATTQVTALSHYVNVFIGTDRMGHTFPGATVPYGMVQVSPQTNEQPLYENGSYNKDTYAYCSGYQDRDTTYFGFAHTQFSGTGHSDLGDILIMPTTGQLILEPGDASIPNSGYHSSYSKKNEWASPGYYHTYLDRYGITAEATASDRVGYHRYTSDHTDRMHILIDLIYNIYNYDGKNVWTFLRVENDSTITGYRQTSGWARTRTVYFAIRFSKAMVDYGYKDEHPAPYQGFYRKFDQYHRFPEMAGKDIRAWFDFDLQAGETIELKCALSGVGMDGALANLESEAGHTNFDFQKKKAEEQWNQELKVIQAEFTNDDDRIIFYTALYHTMLSPVLYEDVDGQYRGLDQNIHRSDGFTNYTIFSLWDTYRALHPLFNLIEPDRNRDMIKSMMAHQEQSVHGMLPVWSHYANENWCMTGYHAVSVLADAAAKGIGGFDLNKALGACVATSTVPYFDGLDSYMEKGFVAEDRSSYSVSKTLEYAYDDWCISQLAILAGDTMNERIYSERSKNYHHVFDPVSGYMRPKLSNGTFRKEFDPMDTQGQGFIEGNAWNYGLYVPQEIDSMVTMMGGPERFAAKLDSLFVMPLEDKYIEKNEDITRDGMIGNYVHGNEPGHHIAYLYNWTNQPWKTQERVRMILKTMYANSRDGLCGNDDAGQMSAWYVLSALGFYPVCPGSPEYAIGSPMITSATIQAKGGKPWHVVVNNQSPANVYVQKVTVNGTALHHPVLLHSDLVAGGEVVFYMGPKPARKLFTGTSVQRGN